jgi:hypothetical protein
MFKSLGNVLVNPNVGLLFNDAMHSKPQRLRVNGSARDIPSALYPGHAAERAVELCTASRP